jgi:serine/threonine-protein kinase
VTPEALSVMIRRMSADETPRAYLRPGDVVDGVYEIVSALGSGGMGVVYLARDKHLARDVAIKFIRPDVSMAPEMRALFLDEARAMARVRHENVVAIHAYGELRGVPYFVMEMVPGPTLEAWVLGRGGPLSGDEAVGICDRLCRGVSAIHAAGAVHRDLKPANILIGPGLRVGICDLGIARIFEGEQAMALEPGGTPRYMAPEMWRGDWLTAAQAQRADVYSLGMIAYELLAGFSPFDAAVAKERERALRDGRLPAPSEVRPDLPRGLDAAILSAIAHDPDKRPATAEALRRALVDARDAMRGKGALTRILVADDDEAIRTLISRSLGVAFPGVEIIACVDGTAALEVAESQVLSLAILDLQMPGLTGLELTMAMRSVEKSRRVPIIVCTAVGGAADWRVLAAVGADAFLVKPFAIKELVATVKRVLGLE